MSLVGVEGSFSLKTTHEKDCGWGAGGFGGRWCRPPPYEDRQDTGQTILDREYHELNVSSLGATLFGVEGSFSLKTALEKNNGWRARWNWQQMAQASTHCRQPR